MRTSLFSALCILILPFQSTAESHPTITCPTLSPDQHVSSTQCERYDGSVVEVDGHGLFNCKLSYVAIRSQITKSHTNQEQEPLHGENEQCEVWLLQFSDEGVAQKSCCGEVGEGLVKRVTGAQKVQDPDLDSAQQPLQFQDNIEEPVQRFEKDDLTVTEDDEDDETEDGEYWSENEDEGEEGGEDEVDYEDDEYDYDDEEYDEEDTDSEESEHSADI
ncbi:hypothetical protein F53441_6643 [Fusarium austroafricanum]|uniref:Uncharacterized protein n=1 Tax=Fusarium austroafricanum TaxID=2364996 RepID=A0A8H4NT46_9HYPO|nr:hypothetical protein F53441_6643 [Fusarium austroafricanum]